MITSLASLWEALCSTPLWVLAGFATGVFVLACGAYALSRSLRFRSWKTTEGEISQSFLRKRKFKDKYGCHIYDPVVRYTYSAQGQSYVADTVSPHKTCQPKQRGAMLNAYYPVGKKVTVYHHPQRPNIAILLPAPWEKRLAVTLVGAVMVAGFGACGLGIKPPQREVAAVEGKSLLPHHTGELRE